MSSVIFAHTCIAEGRGAKYTLTRRMSRARGFSVAILQLGFSLGRKGERGPLKTREMVKF